LMARLAGIPLVVHEQNAVAGPANRWLARVARKVLAGFPGALHCALVGGNPVPENFPSHPPRIECYAGRQGPLRLPVLGRSLGAALLNVVVPQAVARMAPEERPIVTHQAGEQHIESLRKRFHESGVEAECVPFIADMAQAMGQADLVVCRAGAMTVAEVAAA